jgi:putative cardiolipin synthase
MRFSPFVLVAGALGIVSSAFANPAPVDPNQVLVINHAVAALEQRLEMISRAEKSIDVEYFIYNTDKAGRIFTQALVDKLEEQKAKGNTDFKIRVIVDASQTVLKLKDNYISAFKAHGIEVRYYNNVSLARDFKKAQFRDHRKLLSIDGKEAITGSRNIADEYFDLSETFNFRDRDLYVQGPVVKEMEDSFDAFWANERTQFYPSAKPVPADDVAMKFFEKTPADESLKAAVRNVGQSVLSQLKSGQCGTLIYAWDRPGEQTADKRKVLPKLFERLHAMTDGGTLYVESPYFIITDQRAKDQMAFLKEKHIHGVLLTNSLASTDAWYVASNFFPQVSFYKQLYNSEMYAFRGAAPVDMPMVKMTDGHALTEKATWGIHAKSFVFDDDSMAIGTFNLDPRSAGLNTEMLMFCDGNATLANDVRDDMKSRIGASDQVSADGTLKNGKSIFDKVSRLKRFEFKAAELPSKWFSSLL